MTKEREALKLALEALKNGIAKPEKYSKAITAIKEALAQPEQEPFGYFRYDMRLDAWVMNREGQRPGTPFYTTPPKRKPLPPKSPCEMTQAEGKMFKLGWLECEATHGIKE